MDWGRTAKPPGKCKREGGGRESLRKYVNSSLWSAKNEGKKDRCEVLSKSKYRRLGKSEFGKSYVSFYAKESRGEKGKHDIREV